jgi:RHS repeat-associated protein
MGTGAITYLHTDPVGSVVMSTQGTAITAAHQYLAYGGKRGGDEFAFEPNYTGQRLDDSGLLYYQARYYDRTLGVFISPDSLIPDPTHYPAYHRYLYADGSPLQYNDPTGHCATNGDGSPNYNDGQCWALANTIEQQWDSWDESGYWSNRFTSKEVFSQYIAPTPSLGVDFFQTEMNLFFQSDAGKKAFAAQPQRTPPEQDFGDFSAVSASLGAGSAFLGAALLRDDYGNWYFRVDIGQTQGATVTRGDLGVFSNGNYRDIDNLGLSWEEKRALAPDIMIGPSQSLGGGHFNLYVGTSRNIMGDPHMTVEGGLSLSRTSVSISPYSYTIQLYPAFRIR